MEIRRVGITAQAVETLANILMFVGGLINLVGTIMILVAAKRVGMI